MPFDSLPGPLRSPLLMNPTDTLLLVIDAQERLWPKIHEHEDLLPRITMLIDAAKTLGIRVIATEQYPKGLGPTIEPVARRIDPPMIKSAFSAGIEPAVLKELDPLSIRKILIVGVEAHVCVQQTALDLLASGFQIYVAVDGVSSRRPLDAEIAIRRMASAGVVLTTAEAAVFEWTKVAGTAEFKQISELVKSVPVSDTT
ncbi:isochorismatase family protein [bacterium]|nr:isochorismatase family protein [bacterium]